jgi:hypothetical protein
MSEQIFSARPNVELLQWLARGSLKQNLLRAIRLWVWLQFLYGEVLDRSRPSDPFTYASWRDVFFNSNHPKGRGKNLLKTSAAQYLRSLVTCRSI